MAIVKGSSIRALGVCALLLLSAGAAFRVEAQAAAGYSEYIIPGNEGATTGTSREVGLYYALEQLDTGGTADPTNMHSVITVTAWAPNTTLYYDHWEDGLDFDPNNPSTADRTITLATTGTVQTFESNDFTIPVASTTPGTGCNWSTACTYDGGDRIFVAGGAVTVTRAGWVQVRDVGNQAVAWEIYPVKPQLTTYVLPFGENLGVPAFQRVFALVQATANGTSFQVDVNGDGTFDVLNSNRNATKGDGIDSATITLNAGQTYLLDAIAACPAGVNCTTNPGTAPNQLRTGVVIQGSSTLQVKFVAGITTSNYGTRGLSAFPRGYWTKEYYAPLDQRTSANGSGTDYFLHNPHGTALTVSWESRTSGGSFSIPANSTVSYNAVAGPDVPVDSGLYFSAPDVFWGVGLGDTTGAAYEWGYSLLPATFLSAEHFLGWAPGSSTLAVGTYDYVGAFLIAAQDNTRVFVDYNNDGTVDQTYDLDRLETQYIYDTTDGNLTGAHIWATGEFTLAYGQNADTAPTSAPALDLGYVAIPGTDFISLVLDVQKTANPQVVAAANGATTEFTIVASTREYSLSTMTIADTLPVGWQYVSGTTTITRPDFTTVTGTDADPTISGAGTAADPSVLTWSPTDQLDPSAMAPNQTFTVKFRATTPTALAVGQLSQNRVLATGTRTVGSPAVTQTFSATDFAYVATGALEISKVSRPTVPPPPPLYPGDTFGYTVTVRNPSGGAPQNRVSLFDTLPAGVTLAGSVTLDRSSVADGFASQAYNLNAGTRNWSGAWTEVRDDASAAAGRIQVTGGELRLNNTPNPIVAQDNFDTNGSYAGFNGTNNWTGSWTETVDEGTAGAGAILVAGTQLRVNERFDVVDNFVTPGSYAGSNGTQAWSAVWTEGNDDGNAATGAVLVASGQLRLSGLYAADYFPTQAYNRSDGNRPWTNDWTEPGDGGSPTSGRVQVELASGNRLRIGNVAATVADQFITQAYNRNDGTTSWGGNWIETGDDGAANSGRIVINGGELSLRGNAIRDIRRCVDLRSATTATLAFDYDTSNNADADDDIDVNVRQVTACTTGVSTGLPAWSLLDRYTDDVQGTASLPLPTGSFVEIQFGFPAADDFANGGAGAEYFYVDNLTITHNSIAEVSRTIDLTGTSATQGTLAFSYTTSGTLENTDDILVQYRTGGGAWSTLATYTDDVTGTANLSLTLANNLTEIRFVMPATTDYAEAGEYFYVDNLSLAWNQEPTVTRGVNLSSFTGLTQATLSFGCGAVNAGSGDTAQVRYRLGGSGNFTTLATYNNGTCTGTQTLPITVTPSLLEIQFAIPSSPGYTQDGDALAEYFWANAVTVSWVPPTPASVQRGVDLTDSGTTSATLGFSCGVVGGDGAADSFVAQYRFGGSGGWSTLATYTNLTGTANCGSNPQVLTIPSFSPGLLEVRFTVPNATSYVDAGEYFWIDNATVTANGRVVAVNRAIDLSSTGATQATLSFDYRTSATLGAADDIAVEYRRGGTGSWTTLATYTDDVTGSAALPLTLASPANLTEVRFTFPDATDYSTAGQYFYVDNLSITYNQPVTGGNPPGILGSGSLYTLLGGQDLVATFSVTVADPFPTGSTLLTNVAATTSAQFPIQITASVTDQVTVPTIASATVAGRVWLDGDLDGAQDVGEPGISNVQVTLKDRFGTPVATLTTDVNGRYLFTGVAAGTGYYVEVTGGLPTGVAQTYPSPTTYPNRTAPFNLAEGQAYSGADLGYGTQAGTVAFGDVAWVDADSDGLRDAGEVGLGGVTVTLYRDANGDGFLQPGTDTLVGTATTDSDGSYLFAGQTAGGTYFLTASTPSGYFPTNGTVYRFQGTTAGTSYLTADFGFAGTTYSISDRVWRDEDQDGVFDAGESGISGVTIEILDASLNVIGVTTTDANGVFTFSGLAGSGADYTTRISDTTGVLTNFTGTTSYALARQRAESNLDASRDRTAAPSYGYFATRSLGDTLFFDVNGDGDQDAGENGIAGIVVGLYSDTNGDGTIDAGEPLVGSVATDAAGHYLFSGLSNGNYVVSVPPLTGYTYTGTGAAADSDLATAGTQRAAAVSSGGNNFDVDFGFQANTPGSVSGTIWNDGDRDGVVDTGEPRLAGVTVEVLSGTTVVATTTTDASGNYSFTGLASGTYDVRVTDTAGVLTGYFPTYERTEGTAGPFNYRETVNLTSGNQTGVNFGYGQPTPTYASVTSLTASAGGGTVVVEWRTSQEVGTVGFDLYRLEPATGAWTRVNDDLLPALAGSPRGGTYEMEDRTAKAVPPLTYKLAETDAWGARREYGPWTLTALGTTGAPKERYRRTPEQPSADEQSRLSMARKEKDAATSSAALRSGERLKLRTKGNGIRYLDISALATALGQKPGTLTGLVSTGLVSVENRGRQVAYLPAAGGAGLYFFAEAIDDPYTDENVYWVSGRKGVVMASKAGLATARTPAASFRETVHVEVDRYPLPAYFQDPEADFYAWEALYSGYAGWDTKSLTASLPGAAGTGKATLIVRLQGGSSSAAREDHHVTIAWNGKPVGETTWDGLVPREVVVTLAGADVVDGENTLTVKAVRDAGVPYGLVYLDSFDVAYERRYRAVNDELAFTVPAGGEASVGGFATSKVTVFDVTSPATPSVVAVSGVTTEKDGTFAVRFANREPTPRSYVALSLARAGAPAGVSGVAASRLRETTNAADYVLVAPASLVSAAKELATYRESTGVATMVVGLEEIHDEFTYGIASPVAVQELLEYAAASWRKAPEYLTLVGRGTFDYKDAQGVGDNLVPPLLVGTPFGLAASDVSFGSLTDGSGPGLRGIGRLPVLTGQELSDYVAKISAHESAREGAWQKNVLLVADNPDAGGAFTADSEALAALLAPPYGATRVYLPAFSPAAAKAAIVSTLGSGASVFNYVGHGGPDRLAAENIFTKAEVPALTNAGRLPLFLAWTCSAGNYAIPGFTSLSEALVLSKTGGAFAAFAPSGLSLNDGARALNQTFYRSVFVEGEKGVGRSAAKALGELPEEGATAYMKGIYNVIGEPLSRLP